MQNQGQVRNEERAIVERAKSDPEAFGELYDRYVVEIYQLISSRVSSRADAEALTAAVFFRALRGIKGYRCNASSFGAWLYQIAAGVLGGRARQGRSVTIALAADWSGRHAGV